MYPILRNKASVALCLSLVALAALSQSSGDCYLEPWNSVVGAVGIGVFSCPATNPQGECDYEIDGPPMQSFLEFLIDPSYIFGSATSHVISSQVNIEQLDWQSAGYIRILEVLTDAEPDVLLAVEIRWGAPLPADVVRIAGKYWEDPASSEEQETLPGVIGIFETTRFELACMTIDLEWWPSSGPGAADASLELRINDTLFVAGRSNLHMDKFVRPATAIRYGAPQVFVAPAQGSLEFVPLAPTPLNPVF